jgi:hypothetical protein
MWNEVHLQESFDIIIEDGLHTFEANVCFFENSFHKLSDNGIYVIEDILNKDIPRFEERINIWKYQRPDLEFTLLRIGSRVNPVDNNLLVIKKS